MAETGRPGSEDVSGAPHRPSAARGKAKGSSSAHCVSLPALQGFSLHRKTSEVNELNPPSPVADVPQLVRGVIEERGSDDSSGLGDYLRQLNGSGELMSESDLASLATADGSDLVFQPGSRPDSLALGSHRSSLLSRHSSVASASASGPLLFEHFLVVGAEEAAAARLGDAILARRTRSMTDRMRRIFQSGSGSRELELSAVQRRRAAYAAGSSLLSPSRHTFDRTEDSLAVDPAILFRYPPEADPPPQAVNDFCLPVGGHVDYIAPSEEETLVREIFYGQGIGIRGSRCYIFMLEDKTVPVGEVTSTMRS